MRVRHHGRAAITGAWNRHETFAADREPAAGEVLRDEHLLELILDASPDLIYVYDRLEERYLFVSERSTPMLGYTPQQIMQLQSADIHELIHPEDLPHAKAHYAKQEQLADTEISMTTYRVRHIQGDYRLLRCRQKVFHAIKRVEPNASSALPPTSPTRPDAKWSWTHCVRRSCAFETRNAAGWRCSWLIPTTPLRDASKLSPS